MRKTQKQLSIIGAGRVGKTIGWLINKNTSISIGSVLNRTKAKAKESVRFIGAGLPGSYPADLQDACGDVVLISTLNAWIEKTAIDIASTGLSLENKLFFHCSGSLSSTELSALEAKGARVASIHPLKSIASPEDSDQSLSGVYCAVEGDASAVEQLTRLFTQLGGIVFPIATEKKVLYHSAAVITCNYLYALMDIGVDIYEQLGIPNDTAKKLMAPLLHGAIDNALALGPRAALTGPIARGEQAVVKNHLVELQELNPLYATVYSALGKVTANMAFDSQSISKETRDLFHQQFD